MNKLTENELSYIIRGAIIKVYRALGLGLLESVYEMALAYELKKERCEVQLQQPAPVWYDEVKLECGFRLDILVNNSVIIEIKSIENLADVHHKQILTYLN